MKPAVLARPVGLAGPSEDKPNATTGALCRSIGTRDLVLACATTAAPRGRPLAMLGLARIVSDLADASWFGRAVDDQAAPRKVAGAAAGWAAIETASTIWALAGPSSSRVLSRGQG